MNFPLTHLSPIQSLGYLEDGQSIQCSSSLAGFSAGRAYPFRQIPVVVQRTVKRPAMDGPDHDAMLTGRDLCFAATDDTGKERLFIDQHHIGEGIVITGDAQPVSDATMAARADLPAYLRNALAKLDLAGRTLHPHYPLEQLVEHFEITPPPDIAEANPALYQWGLKFLESLEQIVSNPQSAIRNPAGLEAALGRKPQSPDFHWKPFQADDMARVSIPDGAIYSGEPGTGKTPMGIAWALLKVGLNPQSAIRNPQLLTPAAPVLIVAPGGLLHQMQADYAALFGLAWPGVTRIDSQTTLTSLLTRNRGRLAPGWYMSSFEEIGLNKFQVMPVIPDGPVSDDRIRGYLEYFELKGNVATLEQGLEMCRQIKRETSAGLGEERLYTVNEDRGSRIEDGWETPSSKRHPPSSSFSIRCVYYPTLAELMHGQFAAVIIDEAVHIKAEDSLVGMGVRRLNSRYRLVLTGTPIKNRLPDIFFLAAWACDALDKPNDRWPWSARSARSAGVPPAAPGVPPDAPNAMRQFTEEFQVRVRNPQSAIRNPQSCGGLPIAEISNTQKLWAVLSPVVLRRRKCDIPEQEIVPKIHHTVIVPMGVEQARVYQHHQAEPYFDRRGQPAVGAKLMALRAVAAAPCSGSLGSVRSSKPFTPKVRACLEIVRGVLERGEQVVIFSPFHDPLDVLSGYLGAAGIPHDVLDGRMSQKERAHLAMEFKRGLMRNSILYPQSSILAKPVLLAGLKACAEGYSWHLCNNVILFTFDWALDLMRQAVDRCHRINSVKPVHVWSIIVDGTIECKLAAMLDAKGGAADTALDGEQGRAGSPMPAVGTIPGAQGTDRPTFVDEDTCLAAWPRLCQELANAWNSSQAEKKLAA